MFAKMYCAFIGIAIITCFFNYGFVLVEGCIFALILTFMSESGKTGKKTTRDVKKENKYDDAWNTITVRKHRVGKPTKRIGD